MSLQLYFVPSKVPRTITKVEWYECWRWLRVCRKKLKEQLDKEVEMLRKDDLPKHIRDDIASKIINPPLLLGPYMDRK